MPQLSRPIEFSKNMLYCMNEDIREVTLEELLEESFVINEDKLISDITEKELEKYTKIRKDFVVNQKTNLTTSFIKKTMY